MSDTTAPTLQERVRRLEFVPPTYWREVCRYFEQQSTEVATLQELRTHIHEAGDGAETDDRRTIGIELHHATLPKLAARGVIEYDTRSNTVRCRHRQQ